MIYLPENNQYQESLYYQAHIKREQCWFLTAVLRSYEHVAFDRTIDVQNSIFEFFVPHHMHKEFLYVIQELEKRGVVLSYNQLPNRLVVRQ